MGRGKKWSSEERERVAISWTRATHDPVVGRNQSGETFDEKVYSLFSRKPPKDADPGTYSERSHPSVMTCFHNNISPDDEVYWCVADGERCWSLGCEC